MITSTPLTSKQKSDWSDLAAKCYPNEAVAYIVDDQIFPVENVSTKDKTKNFAVSVLDRFNANGGVISGFLHSHTTNSLEGADWPSHTDMTGWLADDTRWGISTTDGVDTSEPVWLDDKVTAPLVGRVFIHGIWDCYAIIRDWYRLERGITLKNYARSPEWHIRGEDLYVRNFADAGFSEIGAKDVLPGDVALMTLNSRGVICHAGIVADDNHLLHHSYSRAGQALSGPVDRGRWAKHITGYLRYSAPT